MPDDIVIHVNEMDRFADAPSEQWEAVRCPECGRATVLYRPRVYAKGAWTYRRIELRNGEYADAICRRCILGPRWMDAAEESA